MSVCFGNGIGRKFISVYQLFHGRNMGSYLANQVSVLAMGPEFAACRYLVSNINGTYSNKLSSLELNPPLLRKRGI